MLFHRHWILTTFCKVDVIPFLIVKCVIVETRDGNPIFRLTFRLQSHVLFLFPPERTMAGMHCVEAGDNPVRR